MSKKSGTTKKDEDNIPTLRETIESTVNAYLKEKIGSDKVTIDGEVVVAITELADNFLRSVIKSSKDISKHRGGKTLEVRDVALHLKNEWDITIPGYTGMQRTRVNSRRKALKSSVDEEAAGVHQSAMTAKRQFEKNEMKKKRASKKRKKDTTEDASEDSSEDGNETKKPANRGRKRRKPSSSR